MKALKERILRDGKCLEGGILKVDNFINHQMDPILMKSIGVEFVRRFASDRIDKVITVEVYSFTKNRSYDVCVSKDFLCKGDRVLFIDDFLANGNAAKGILDLVQQAGAEVVGMGFIIEKSFEHGGDMLREMGIKVESLAIIDSLDNCQIKIRD